MQIEHPQDFESPVKRLPLWRYRGKTTGRWMVANGFTEEAGLLIRHQRMTETGCPAVMQVTYMLKEGEIGSRLIVAAIVWRMRREMRNVLILQAYADYYDFHIAAHSFPERRRLALLLTLDEIEHQENVRLQRMEKRLSGSITGYAMMADPANHGSNPRAIDSFCKEYRRIKDLRR